MDKTPGQRDVDAEIRVGWKMGALGLTASSEVMAGALLGWCWDAWQGTGRTGVMVGSLAGIAVALWTLIKGSLQLNRQLDRMHPTKGRGNPIPFDDTDDDDDPDD